jgi:large subunit ribosomal protein L4
MATITMKTAAGADAGTVELPDDIFGIEPNVAVMHQVVTAQLAARRAGTHSTKTRSEVRGGGAKPWRQKGTGRARQGSIRAPQWRGGGVAHGPKPRDYSQRTPKKIDDWAIDAPKTKDAVRMLEAVGLRTKGEREARVLLVLFRDDDAAWKSLRNLGERVQIVLPEELNTYDVLLNDWLVFSETSLQTVVARLGGSTANDSGAADEAVDDEVEGR